MVVAVVVVEVLGDEVSLLDPLLAAIAIMIATTIPAPISSFLLPDFFRAANSSGLNEAKKLVCAAFFSRNFSISCSFANSLRASDFALMGSLPEILIKCY